MPPSALVLGPGPEHAPAAPRRKPAPGLVKHLGRPAGRFARPQILHQPDPGAAGLPRLALAGAVPALASPAPGPKARCGRPGTARQPAGNPDRT